MADKETGTPKPRGTMPFVPDAIQAEVLFLTETPAFAKGQDEVPVNQNFVNTNFLAANPATGILDFPDLYGIMLQVELGLDEVQIDGNEYQAIKTAFKCIQDFIIEAKKRYARTREIAVYGTEAEKAYFLSKGFVNGGQ